MGEEVEVSLRPRLTRNPISFEPGRCEQAKRMHAIAQDITIRMLRKKEFDMHTLDDAIECELYDSTRKNEDGSPKRRTLLMETVHCETAMHMVFARSEFVVLWPSTGEEDMEHLHVRQTAADGRTCVITFQGFQRAMQRMLNIFSRGSTVQRQH